MSLHTPERLSDESFAAYRARRTASNKANRDAQRNPNHGLVGSRTKQRDDMRKSGTMGKRVRAYVALMAASASKRIAKITRRDENGSYTLTGRAYFPDGTQRRRMWLAGISSQRGF